MSKVSTILLVEDEESLIEPLKIFLNKRGYTLIRAKNGDEGLKMAKEYKPDLIITDILMPIMDGLTMLEKLRKDPWGKSAKVIVLTNHPDQIPIGSSKRYTYEHRMIKSDVSMVEVTKKIESILKDE